MLVAGLAMGLVSVLVKGKTLQVISAMLAGTFFLSAAMQIIIYRSRPKFFDDKPEMKEH